MSTASSGGLLDNRTMTAMQVAIILICCLTNIADGVDIASLAFAAPVLMKEWGLRPGMLGIVFGATGFGLLAGAVLIAPLADKFGRRRVILTALATLAISLVLTSHVPNVPALAVLRFVTGIALGTMTVCLNVAVAEFSNARWRTFAVAMLHTGFTLGTMLGGTLAALLLKPYGWRSVFLAAGLLNTLTFVLTLLLIPESPSFLVARRPAGALDRLNKVLRHIRQAPVPALPDAEAQQARAGLPSLFVPSLRTGTLLIWLAQFLFAVVGYLLMSWQPTVLVKAGFTPQQAGYSSIVVGTFGIAGHAVMGWLARRLGPARLSVIFLALLAGTFLAYGWEPATLPGLILTGALAAFFNVGVYSGLFLITLAFYPPALRTSGVGSLVGIARIGGIVGPVLGGLMFELGVARGAMFSILAVIALLTMASLVAVRRQVGEAPSAA